MKKVLAVLVTVFSVCISCNNESETPAVMEDSAKVVPPVTAQDSMSLTDTSYRIGDSTKQ